MHSAYTQRRESKVYTQTHTCTASKAEKSLRNMGLGFGSSCKAVSDATAVRAHCALVTTDLHSFKHHLSCQPVGGICEECQEAEKTFFCQIPSYTPAIILLST